MVSNFRVASLTRPPRSDMKQVADSRAMPMPRCIIGCSSTSVAIRPGRPTDAARRELEDLRRSRACHWRRTARRTPGARFLALQSPAHAEFHPIILLDLTALLRHMADAFEIAAPVYIIQKAGNRCNRVTHNDNQLIHNANFALHPMAGVREESVSGVTESPSKALPGVTP